MSLQQLPPLCSQYHHPRNNHTLEWSATLLLLRSLGGFEAAYISAATVTVYYVLLLQAVKETGLNGPSQEDLSVHSSRDNEYSSSRAIAAGRGYECALAAASVLNLVTMILVADDSAATTAASVLGLDSLLRHDFEALPAVAVFVATQLCSWFLQVCIGHFCIEGSTPSMISRLTINSAILSPALIFHIFLEEVARL